MSTADPVLSIVVPLYNEAENLDRLFSKVAQVCNRLQVSYEIICVDDGSQDCTVQEVLTHRQQNPAIKLVVLSRNFGKEIALTAGLDAASGAAIVPIDADLQDPPELIEQLMERWREGYDVVLATRRTRRGESWLKRLTARGFYKTIARLSHIPIPLNTGDFRLMDRKVLQVVRQMPERARFMKGMFAWVGFPHYADLLRSPLPLSRSKSMELLEIVEFCRGWHYLFQYNSAESVELSRIACIVSGIFLRAVLGRAHDFAGGRCAGLRLHYGGRFILGGYSVGQPRGIGGISGAHL